MTKTLNNPLRWVLAAGVVSLLLFVGAGSARAASYPVGGGSFSGGLEGWSATKATCNVALLELCKSTVAYDGAEGNPAGSLEQKTETLLGALGLLAGEVTVESPTFQAVQGGSGTVHVDRSYEPGGLLKLAPSLAYKVSLVDKTSGSTTKAIEETVTAASPFSSASGNVTLVSGHTYALLIESKTSALIELPLPLLANTFVHFDNVSLTGPGDNGGNPPNGKNGNDGGNGGNGSGGANGLTNSQLASLLQSSLVGPATLSGNKLSVKAKCPAKVGVACKVTLQGMLSRKKPATGTRSAKVAVGKIKKFALKVKPASKSKLATKKKLLFKETVKAGAAKATVYKTLKLVRH